ncbi:16S rRNA (guanine527-N7)-methyltransferase [Marinospirillum celere]|uniref:Ribosomal RNA small subunit methyltransferase G n=1 Tax=Marinospirillum celere TaxID=1122252 RepID=A0A1I1ICH1_9GAMM|nr:16S rRNA (guanine(527)-N(7))-methyltransferase RsmG [Marinospirillum celere]SFC31908.1 16S rRNA (guanine527-N7)-methyltransferase [Marinospirillum celere]
MMVNQKLVNLLEQGLKQLERDVSERQERQLLDYLLLLDKWNQAYNLTAIRDPAEMVSRHLLDSLSLLPYVSQGELLDIGSGAGLPGIPLAILRPDLDVHSLDSNGKKTRFQFQVKTALGLSNFSVHQARVENFQPTTRSQQLVSRAFASLRDFLSWTQHLATQDARWLAMKGQYPSEELEDLPAGFELTASHKLEVPGQEGQRHLLILQRQL